MVKSARTQTAVLFTFRMIPMIAGELARHGIDATALLAEAGLPGDALRGEVTAPLVRIQKFVDLAAKAAGSETFGLELADRVPTGAFGVAEFLVRSAATAEAALRVLCEFAALINPIGRFQLTIEHGEGELHYSVPAQRDTLGCHLNEYTIAYIVRQFGATIGATLGAPMPLVHAWFSHGRRSGADAVAKRLGTRVRFQAGDCGFAVSREVLERRPSTADPALHNFLLTQARAQLGHLGPVDVVSQVARVIEMRLPQGEVSSTEVARAMATTVRSLQRHLADAGTAYRDVLSHVRMRRRDELRAGGVAEAEIASQLGFSDARAMRRALGDSDDTSR